ncbi:MAG: zinc ABC transporter substrate-binding protein [Epsilonproteobacteria bacterium]|nr:MAG: zinc ABC transporter substrate-binding protein [Campylobacterota bacterium]
MKKALLLVLFLLVVVAFIATLTPSKSPSDSNKPMIVVSTFALYDVLTHLAREHADVVMLVPFGVDVHTYEPTPQDMVNLEKSDLFVYSGAGLEPWTATFSHIANKLDMSVHVDLLTFEEQDSDKEDAHEHHHNAIDPHYWLDISNMIKVTNTLESVLIDLLGPHLSKTIDEHAASYRKGLQVLDQLYQKRLASCERDTIVVSHNAFGYLGKRYGFHIEALTALSPDAIPSAKTMAELSDLVKKRKLTTVFYESFVSDRLIQSIAKETDARVDVLQPLANITAEEAEQFQDYSLLMNINLQKLRHALKCQ